VNTLGDEHPATAPAVVIPASVKAGRAGMWGL
jgi:hypothetical protein